MQSSNKIINKGSKAAQKGGTLRTVQRLCATAVFAAMVTVCILVLHIPTTVGGYIHVADGVIYLAACILPAPYAVFAAAVGGALSDLLAGAASYIIPTLIVKSVLALCFSSKSGKILTKRNVLATLPAAAANILLYAVAAVVLQLLASSSPAAALAAAAGEMPMNLVQSAASTALFFALGAGLDKLGFKQKVNL